MKTITTLIAAVFIASFLFLSSAPAAEIPAARQDHPIAITGATIHTVSGREIEHGTILFDKGKIIALGTDVQIPSGAEIIDATGKHVYPGMIDARSIIGLTEIESVRATNDISEVGDINSNIKPEVAINPESDLIPVTRANGVTMAAIFPGGGTISGSAALIELDGWTWEDMTYKSPVGMRVNWPSMAINHAWWERRSEEDQKKDRDKALDGLRNAFKEARAYLKAKHSEGNSSVPYHNVDMRWDALEPVIEGKIPVFVDAEEIQQIEAAVAWADQEQIKLVILGGYDSWRAADLLKAKKIPVIVNPIMQLPWRRFEQYDMAQSLPKRLHDAGVTFCIAGDGGASNERNLPYHAAMAAGHGLPKDEALKAVTLYPAQILGVADKVGSLDLGKDATLIVTTGDPLEISSNVEMEFIQGKKIALTTRHTRLYEKYKIKYEQQKAAGSGSLKKAGE
ncbi:MAG: amidohydrolase family protein [Bacteroidota bacterium]